MPELNVQVPFRVYGERNARIGVWVLVSALCAAPPAAAEIFKCVGKNGTDLYQNFPCQFDSLGSLPSSPLSAKTTLPPGDARQAMPKAAPVDVASTGKST